jgi:hypothetical protein
MERDEPEVIEYETPKIVDYGSLSELTKSGHVVNKDLPGGDPSTANFS